MFNMSCYALIMICWYKYLLDINFVQNASFLGLTFDLKVKFSKSDFNVFMENGTLLGITMGGLALAFAALMTLYKCLNPSDIVSRNQSYFQRLLAFFNSLFYIWMASALFLLSVPIFTRGVDQPTPKPISEKLALIPPKLAQIGQELHLISSYGLFRRMTGVGGRPEVIIEGANSLNGPWKEYHFRYKPGNLTGSPKFVLPHQPRLDWQMWFAALGNYQHNPWFISLLYRLLEGILCLHIHDLNFSAAYCTPSVSSPEVTVLQSKIYI